MNTMNSFKEVSIDTLNNGAITDLFNEEFEKLLNNIADENTKSEVTRELKISVKVKPSKDRSQAVTTVSVTNKLAPIKPHEGSMVFSYDGEKLKAFTSDVTQPELPNITKIKEA